MVFGIYVPVPLRTLRWYIVWKVTRYRSICRSSVEHGVTRDEVSRVGRGCGPRRVLLGGECQVQRIVSGRHQTLLRNWTAGIRGTWYVIQSEASSSAWSCSFTRVLKHHQHRHRHHHYCMSMVIGIIIIVVVVVLSIIIVVIMHSVQQQQIRSPSTGSSLWLYSHF